MLPPVICVHQMGKVGSTSVVSALNQLLPEHRIHQTHLLSEVGILRGMEWWLDQPNAPRAKIPDHLLASIELAERLPGRGDSAEWFLVCLVREPLGRNVSAFFQNLHRRWLSLLPEESRETCAHLLKPRADEVVSEDARRTLVRDLGAVFETKFPHDGYDRWFDEELRDVFGIDVFGAPFPTEQGFKVYRNGATRMLIIRIEELSRAFKPGVREWLDDSSLAPASGAASWTDQRSNDSDTKRYADLYRDFRNHYRMPAELLAQSCESPAARLFYTPSELAESRLRWENQVFA